MEERITGIANSAVHTLADTWLETPSALADLLQIPFEPSKDTMKNEEIGDKEQIVKVLRSWMSQTPKGEQKKNLTGIFESHEYHIMASLIA